MEQPEACQQVAKYREFSASLHKFVRLQGRGPLRAPVASEDRGGRGIYLGSFEKPEDAHLAYQAAAKAHFGDFASAG